MTTDKVSDLRGFEAQIARKPTVREVVAVEVIRVTYHHGMGTDDDPGRVVRSYYTKAGELIGNDDPYNAPTLDQIEKPTTKRAPKKARRKKGKP